MSDILKSQVEARQKLWHEAKAIVDGAEAEKREMNAQETERFEKLTAEIDQRKAFIDEYQTIAEREARAAQAAEGFTVASPASSDDNATLRRLAKGEIRSFEFGAEKRAGLTPSTSGAPIPTSFYDQVVMKAATVGPMLTTSKILNTSSGEIIQVPSVSGYSTGTLTAAGSAFSESDPTFNSFVNLAAWKYGYIVSVARELVEDTGVDLLGFIADQTGIGLGKSVNAALTTGTGTTQPQGIVTAASSAVLGGTGVSGAFTATDLINLVYSLDTVARRQPGAGFQMNNTSIAAVRSLKDNYGRFIFYPALSADKLDLLLGYPIYENPDMASPATGAKSVIFGDLGSYFVRTVGGIKLDRSDDYAFANDQVVFRASIRLDGALPQASHVQYFKGAAS